MVNPLVATAVALLALCLLLTFLVVTRKLRRDRNEAVSRSRRATLHRAIDDDCEGPIVHLLRRSGGSRSVQNDLLFVLADSRVSPADRLSMTTVAEETGLIELLYRQLRSSSPDRRGRAGLLLGRLRVPDAVDDIEHLLTDEDGDVRLVAAESLWQLGTTRAARALVEGLRAEVLPAPRLIERLSERWAVPVILNALSDGSPLARPALAQALGLSGAKSAAPVLEQMLVDGNTEERISAARALGSCGSRANTAALVAASSDENWEVRAQVVRTLGRLHSSDCIPVLAHGLSDPGWWVRANSAEALGHLGEPGRQALERALSHPDRFTRERAAEALAIVQHREKHDARPA